MIRKRSVTDGTTVGCFIHPPDGGFCLAGADPLVLAVYLYCPTGTHGSQKRGCLYVLRQIGIRLAVLHGALARKDPGLQVYQDDLARRALLWTDLTAGPVPARGPVSKDSSDPVMLELPLTCKWNQTPPYNDRCPALPAGSSQHTVVGCVATAMAQIIYYWKWPNTGVGSESGSYDYRGRNDWDEEPLATNPKLEWGTNSWSRQIGSGSLARLTAEVIIHRAIESP